MLQVRITLSSSSSSEYFFSVSIIIDVANLGQSFALDEEEGGDNKKTNNFSLGSEEEDESSCHFNFPCFFGWYHHQCQLCWSLGLKSWGWCPWSSRPWWRRRYRQRQWSSLRSISQFFLLPLSLYPWPHYQETQRHNRRQSKMRRRFCRCFILLLSVPLFLVLIILLRYLLHDRHRGYGDDNHHHCDNYHRENDFTPSLDPEFLSYLYLRCPCILYWRRSINHCVIVVVLVSRLIGISANANTTRIKGS